MNVIIENLGPIRKMEFDLDKKISIFCGPNNTGKTYVSYILYAFTRRRISLPEDKLTEAQLIELISNQKLELLLDANRVYEIMMERLESIKNDLTTIFGVTESMAKALFSGFKIGLSVDKMAFGTYMKKSEYSFVINYKSKQLAIVKKEAGKNVLSIELVSPIAEENREAIRTELLSQIFFKLIISPIYDSHFFPVERNSLYTYYKDISFNRNQLFDFLQGQEGDDRKAALDFVLRNTSRFPLVISHTLNDANRMSQLSKETGFYAALADEIEREILNGRISLTEDGDLRFASEKAIEKIVPIQLSASMTKSVSGIVFYLRHLSEEGDLMFIDEPEVNCHPNTQILISRIFAKMVRAGIRLVVSTHSDYIIRELNNLIMLSGVHGSIDNQLRQWGYDEDVFLTPDEVAAYLFTYGSDNLVDVESIEVSDSGFEVITIDETISSLNEISENLYYRLRYGNNEESKQEIDA